MSPKAKIILENIITVLDYSRVELATDARHRVCSCGHPPQMPCNEADAVRSARLKGKECRHREKELHGKRVECYAEGNFNVTGRYIGK